MRHVQDENNERRKNIGEWIEAIIEEQSVLRELEIELYNAISKAYSDIPFDSFEDFKGLKVRKGYKYAEDKLNSRKAIENRFNYFKEEYCSCSCQ
jgi:hypothetical protein